MYSKNEVVVYRKGMYRISEIIKGDSKDSSYYVLVPYENDDGSLRVQVPVLNKMGYLRKLPTRQEIEQLIEKIPQIPVIEKNNRMLEAEYRIMLKNPALEDLIRIIKTTYLRNQERLLLNKKSSRSDQDYFDEAERILYQQIAYVYNLDYEGAKQYVLSKLQ